MINYSALNQCIDAPVLKRSVAVSIVVGTILCAINQGDAILAGESIVVWKVVLTYVVPFCVATYGAYSACVAHSKMTDAKPNVPGAD
ncbi:MAG: nitrate/nitrite transporter NrtS [Erythrobacter sp.]|uniref:nitrate/nitrite transporter NrtS n=1 Tax=Erythrobacter sp. TaxID=1042 RepID=UPI0032632EDE